MAGEGFPTSPSDGDEYTTALGTVYKYHDTDDKWYIIGSAIDLDDLDDVVISGTPADNEILSYDSSSSTWINQTAAEASIEPAFSKNTAFNKDFGTSGTEICVGDDSRLSDSRTPTAHKTSHEDGGGDEISVVGLSGLLADGQTPLSHDNAYHSTNYHTEADGTGVVTVHSDITSAGSGIIITAGERSAIGDALKVQGIDVDDADIDNGKILKYNSTSGNLEYEIDDTGAGFAPPIGFIAMFSGSWTDNSTIPGWYKCDGNNGTVNLVNKFVRGAATSGGSGGSDDAVVVTHGHTPNTMSIQDTNHGHNFEIKGKSASSAAYAEGSAQVSSAGTQVTADNDASHRHTFSVQDAGVSGVNANIPAYYALIFIQRIS